ncbi:MULTISPECIES: GNAT family N-acetyltransferase [Streptomyces]|uniref:GNAT family N-acetyltransferase n=1 Tax=Streptomyces TaxID=1883 RepID=UPI001674A7AF|nr:MULTISPECIES: GNAT family protein [Streptomyces]MBK3525306.1 GNAT family N-acetyltransferase [Streptomyces sp. MBT70]GGS03045.1 ribosomal protein S5 alanine N-acetyltransferase [Streptomyces eurythermus]
MIIPDEVLPGGIRLRLVSLGDAEALYSAYAANRDHLAPWEPRRPDSFFTVEGQAERIREQLRQFTEQRAVPWVFESHGAIIGTITLSGMAFGPFCSAYLGYWVAADQQNRGLASAGVASVCRAARAIGLHRIEATTLLDNAPSQRVLSKNGFEPIGMAPRYLHINGEWRDHRLFQRILHDGPPSG